MNQIIRYPGSKARLADWIIGYFPEHHSYLEPFLGSGAVLFRKPRSPIETVNDLDGEVINLFECIRRDPDRLAWEIYNTPYARETYEAADEPVDAYSRATKLCIRANQGYGFRTAGSPAGWKRDVCGREKAYTARDWCRLPDAIGTTAGSTDRVYGRGHADPAVQPPECADLLRSSVCPRQQDRKAV